MSCQSCVGSFLKGTRPPFIQGVLVCQLAEVWESPRGCDPVAVTQVRHVLPAQNSAGFLSDQERWVGEPSHRPVSPRSHAGTPPPACVQVSPL